VARVKHAVCPRIRCQLQNHPAGSYYRPEGFALGQLGEFAAQAEHIVDDANSTEPNNVAQRVEQFVTAALKMAAHIEGNDIMFTMGGVLPAVLQVSQPDVFRQAPDARAVEPCQLWL
jgi:hypothetical protein